MKLQQSESSRQQSQTAIVNPSTIPFTQSSFNFINSVRFTLSAIPTLYKYLLPLIVLTVNTLQLQFVNVIDSYKLSMDPADILRGQRIQWWRLCSYIVAIDSAAGGVWEIIKNCLLILVLGHSLSNILIAKYRKMHRETTQNQKELVDLETIVDSETFALQYPDLFNQDFSKWSFKQWTIKVLLFIPFFSLTISLINCFVWFIWTRFGQHTFISTGFLPLVYYSFCRALPLTAYSQQQQLSFGVFPVKLSANVQKVILGLVLMLFSMEGQSVFIAMFLVLDYKTVFDICKSKRARTHS